MTDPTALLAQYARMIETAMTTGLPLLEGTIDYSRVVSRIARRLQRAAGGEALDVTRDVEELRRIAGIFMEARNGLSV